MASKRAAAAAAGAAGAPAAAPEDEVDRLRLARDWAGMESALRRYSKHRPRAAHAATFEACARAELVLAEGAGGLLRGEAMLQAVLAEDASCADAQCVLGQVLLRERADDSRLVLLCAQPALSARHAPGVEALGRHRRDAALLARAAALYGALFPPGHAAALRAHADLLPPSTAALALYSAVIGVRGAPAADTLAAHTAIARLSVTLGPPAHAAARDALAALRALGPLPDAAAGAAALLFGPTSAAALAPQLAALAPRNEPYAAAYAALCAALNGPGGPRGAAVTAAAHQMAALPLWRAHYAAGLALCHAGRIRAALPLLRSAYAASGAHAAPALALALALWRRRPDTAQRVLAHLLARWPRYAPALALSAALAGPATATRDWAAYVAASPARAWAALAMRGGPARLACAQRALNADAADSAAQLAYAAAQPNALPALAALVAAQPAGARDAAAARVALAHALLAAQRPAAAIAQLWGALREGGARDPHAWQLLGRAALAEGDARHAAACFAAAVRLEAAQPPMPWPPLEPVPLDP